MTDNRFDGRRNTSGGARGLALALGMSAASLLGGAHAAHAQDAPPPAPPPPPPAEAMPMPTPPPAQSAATSAPTSAPTAPNPPQPPPPPPPVDDDPLGPKYKTLNTNVWLHTGLNFNNPNSPKKLNDIYGSGNEVDLLFSGKVHRNLAYQADFVATWPGPNQSYSSAVEILDLIAKIESSDNIANIWFGRMLVPSDRANFSGFWFAAPWTYPGAFLSGFSGPAQGPFGRNDGATLWGQFLEGRVKYYAGAYDLNDGKKSPLISTRLNLALLSPEPGYYHSSTYYGEDHLSLAGSYQYQKNGSTPAMGSTAAVDDYSEVSTDLLFEKALGAGGTIDLEGAFYAFQGDNRAYKTQFFALASWLTPDKVGWGKLQPLVRWQSAKPTTGDSSQIIDAQVAYVIDGYAARITAGYTYASAAGGLKSNTIFAGIQLQK